MPLIVFLLMCAAGAYYLARTSSSSSTSSPDDSAAAPAEPAAAAPDLVAEVVGGANDLATAVGRTVSSLWKPPASAEPYLGLFAKAAQKYGLPEQLQLRQLDIESDHFAPDVIAGNRPSSAGAVGIAQFEPATAAELGIDPTSPSQAIDAGAKYLRKLYDQFGSWELALAAYDWGPGHVKKYLAGELTSLPAETQQYVKSILGPIGLPITIA